MLQCADSMEKIQNYWPNLKVKLSFCCDIDVNILFYVEKPMVRILKKNGIRGKQLLLSEFWIYSSDDGFFPVELKNRNL